MKSKASCNPFSKCEIAEKSGTHPIIVLKDRKGGPSMYRLKNNARHYVASNNVEDCLVNSDSSQCDFLVIDCGHRTATFVELKGSDLIQAVKQIQSALIQLRHQIPNDMKIHGRIVLTRVNTHDLHNNAFLRLQKQISHLGGVLKKSSNGFLEETNA